MIKKLGNIFKTIIGFLDKHWQELTFCMLVFILSMQLYPISVRVVNAFSAIPAYKDWGVGPVENNLQPRGDLSKAELLKYNSYYIGNSEKKELFLTFDAGYESGYTESILDTLKECNVKAAFFLTGHYFRTQPDLVLRMHEEGHIVANHTMSHPSAEKLSDIEILKTELEGVEELFKKITDSDMPKIYRPPQGSYSSKNLEQSKALGYTTVFWSLAYVDWDSKNQPSQEYAINKLNSRIHNGAVILLHSTSETNAKILKTIITQWQNDGYEFKSLSDLWK